MIKGMRVFVGNVCVSNIVRIAISEDQIMHWNIIDDLWSIAGVAWSIAL